MNPHRPCRWIRLLPTLSLAFGALGTSAALAAPHTAPPATDPADSGPVDSGPLESGPVDSVPAELPDGYVWLVDDTGVITVAAPEAWTDVDTAPAPDDINGNPQPWIAAAPSIDAFLQTFDEPGVLYVAMAYDPDPQFILDTYSITAGCSSFELQEFSDHGFTGLTNIGTGCGDGGGASWQLVVASPPDQSFTVMVQVQTVTADDLEAADLALDSFTTTGEPMATAGSSIPGSNPPAPSVPATTEATG